ncbi:hypothetical protein [Thalassovita aquimarina]|uniref:Type IV pilus biogenesis n=1 Tax=Thalassovita aquimarina TaxID=2785917 RepID=A0ABS5HQE1_9RHOB|nr:hypothetical protein [Thalassovita aquimarina]MBR9651186.1 hypothetical protein [Thalassovita aquimarina]
MHRVPTGWHLVGSVRFDDDDLTGALDDLREAAFRLEPDGLTSKLVLPDEQIKYLDIPVGGAGPNSYEAMANRAMEGASPYDLSELAIDWVEKDGQLQIAAVARETLAEAEAFAHEHQFNPVSFVARTSDGVFFGEPFFGGTHAATELFGGPVTPDKEPIKIIGSARPSEPETAPEPTRAEQPETAADPAPKPKTPKQAPLIEEIGVPSFDIINGPEQAPEASPEPATDATSEPEDYEEAARLAEQELGPDRPLTPEEEEMLKAFEAEAADATADLPAAPSSEPPAAETPASIKPAPEAENPDGTTTPPLSFSTVRAKRDEAPDSAPPLSGAQRGLAEAKDPDNQGPDVSKPIPVAETQADDPSAAILDMAASLRPTEPQEPARSSRKSFFNRGKRSGATSDRGNKTATRKEPLPDSLPATAPVSVPEPETEAERLTVFGAREGDAVGGKPRYLGLVLTALLLVFLVVMAAWASFSTDGLASLFRRDAGDSVAAALSPEMATEEELAEAGTPATATTEPPLDEAIALPAPELEPEPDLPDALQDTPDPAALPTLQSTEERYATTGIWQAAPDQPDVPGTSALDDLYVASIDHPVLAFDAVALPDPKLMSGDASPAMPSDPVAAGTRFDFDQRGLVKASPEGSLTPEGIVIYSGKPPATPPKWPERQEGRSEVNELENTRLAALRPRTRPEDLIEQTERNNLGGRTRVELAALRPRLRPESAQEQAADDKPTANAVVASLLPKNRPTNFSDIVARTEKQSEVQLATGSIFKPEAVQPALPTKASVARQATVKNQINLRKINLIGVYGQPSNRRALVRLSSGRYKKVKVGDRINGGKVAAIGESELRYVKSGRSITLKMPKG